MGEKFWGKSRDNKAKGSHTGGKEVEGTLGDFCKKQCKRYGKMKCLYYKLHPH